MNTQLVSVRDVAKQLACSPGHVYNLIAAGHFHPVEIKATGARSKTRLLAHEVEAYIEKQTRTVRGGPEGEDRRIDGT